MSLRFSSVGLTYVVEEHASKTVQEEPQTANPPTIGDVSLTTILVMQSLVDGDLRKGTGPDHGLRAKVRAQSDPGAEV